MSEMGGGLNRLPERKAQDAVMDTGLSMLATFMSLRDLAGDAWQDKLEYGAARFIRLCQQPAPGLSKTLSGWGKAILPAWTSVQEVASMPASGR